MRSVLLICLFVHTMNILPPQARSLTAFLPASPCDLFLWGLKQAGMTGTIMPACKEKGRFDSLCN